MIKYFIKECTRYLNKVSGKVSGSGISLRNDFCKIDTCFLRTKNVQKLFCYALLLG